MRIITDLLFTDEQQDSILAQAREIASEENVHEPQAVRVFQEKGELCLQVLGQNPITRVRRITGYLSTTDRFNDAKLAELANRTPHMGQGSCSCDGELDAVDLLCKQKKTTDDLSQEEKQSVLADFSKAV
ncbi:hypothetical protein GJ688_09120 [Heliobacillus mobilis]|uniref:Uncharacterized protein n=1 Tax=Heliobacterium mobile TaxID=28064 RepID=A0A6I3SJS5_HELMO|nr:anaerobic ribonucleoside-triphosphate reductase [Heliobacterium mobile]MTV49140.1 hypothetical protein [Heliobacterium mobile]